jgi:hypothetical protein
MEMLHVSTQVTAGQLIVVHQEIFGMLGLIFGVPVPENHHFPLVCSKFGHGISR